MNNNDHKGNFFPELIFGMMIGAGLLWFFTKTKEGQKMSERFKEKGIDKLENLGKLIEDIEEKGMEFKEKVEEVKTEIKEKFELNEGEVDNTSKEKLSKIEDLRKRGQVASKKFFTKNGRSLS